VGALALAAALLAAAASTAVADPVWRLDALSNSTAAPGSTLTYEVEIRNVGDVNADPGVAPITFSGTLPPGLTIQSVGNIFDPFMDCSGLVPGSQTFTCQSTNGIGRAGSGDFRRLEVLAAVDPSASGLLTTSFTIAGGGAPAGASTVASATITDAPPAFGIAAFDADVTADAAGTPFTQAGGHPFEATTSIDFNTFRHPDPFKGDLTPVEATKDVTVDLPPGFFGDPSGVGRCTLSQLANAQSTLARTLCPASSQVGTTIARSNGTIGGYLIFGPVPVFNMVPPVDAPARLGFNIAGTVVTLDVGVRSATDYGLTAHVRNISEGLAVASTSVTLWGVPSDPVHDPERACPGQSAPWQNGPSCSSGVSASAFLRNPTSCPDPGIGLPTTVAIDSWANPGVFRQTTILSHLDPGYPFPPTNWGPETGTTGCARVPFDPSIAVAPDTSEAGVPTGFAVDVSLPQTSDPSTIGQSDLRKAVVTLPLGVHINPSSASGLQGCSPAQIALHTDADASCPGGSKLGSVTIRVPALQDPLEGSVYLAGPHDNPFDTLMAIYIVARGSGVTIKLSGRIDLDPFTGQITTTVDDNPQAPFSNVHLAFKGGPRAPIVNPSTCGAYTTQAEFTGWSGKVVDTSSTFNIDSNCHGPQFSPGFAAGTESPAAGTSSPFHAHITRGDDDQELNSVTLNMPNGLTGKIASATLCGAADAQAGTCPEAARIGSVTTGAGAGVDPFYITSGRAYITGPYKGAPFGLSIVVPAVAGPFDLGNVVVRSAIFVDKHDATLRIVADPLPTILQGVRLLVRDVRVAIDKPGFMVNPTSCAEKHITGTIGSTEGLTAAVSERFQAADCQALSFKPRMTLAIGSAGRTARGASTPFSTMLHMPAGGANLRLVRVTLPTTVNARLPIINRACTRAAYEAGRCDGARAGTVVAVTPLLRDPLHGNAYFVKNGHPLPDLFIALRGQVSFDLIGRVSIPGSTHLATTFDSIPDVPVSSFSLKFVAGPQGPVGAATNLCSKRGRTATAQLQYQGQNGKVQTVNQRLQIRGCGSTRGHRAAHRRSRRH
jgi:uncharacterized repeat protein (TIGR01451 family)